MFTKYIVKTSTGVFMELWRKGEHSKNTMDEVVERVMSQILAHNKVRLYVMRYTNHVKVGVVGSNAHCVISYTQHKEIHIA